MLPALKPTTSLLDYLRDLSMHMYWQPYAYNINQAIIEVAMNPDRKSV